MLLATGWCVLDFRTDLEIRHPAKALPATWQGAVTAPALPIVAVLVLLLSIFAWSKHCYLDWRRRERLALKAHRLIWSHLIDAMCLLLFESTAPFLRAPKSSAWVRILWQIIAEGALRFFYLQRWAFEPWPNWHDAFVFVMLVFKHWNTKVLTANLRMRYLKFKISVWSKIS